VSNTGHKCVYKSSCQWGKPFYAAVRVGNKVVRIGDFASIPEGIAAVKGFKKGLKESYSRLGRGILR
jgi:hypothetical protein